MITTESIIEILKKHTSEVDNWNKAIFEEQFQNLADVLHQNFCNPNVSALKLLAQMLSKEKMSYEDIERQWSTRMSHAQNVAAISQVMQLIEDLTSNYR